MMKHMQKSDKKSDLPWFSYGYRKCMVVDFLVGYKSLAKSAHYQL